MQAVVLVGGFGTRLRPLTAATPKQMLTIVDRPMIEHVLAHLGRHGITEVVLSLGFKPDAFSDAYPDGVCAGLRLHYAVEPEPLDTAGAVRFAAEHAGITDRFVVHNGDNLTDLDLTQLVELHADRGAEATIALHRVEDPSAYGVVPTDANGRVLAFVEKPEPGTAPTDQINAGTYVLEPSVLGRIAEGRKVSIERETFPAIAADERLYAMPQDTYWIDAGTPEAYLRAQLDLVDGRRGDPWPAVSPEAEIDPGAAVEHSIVVAGASIGNGAKVRDSAVLAGAVIEAGAVVEGSIVGPGAQVGADARLTNLCVLGEGVAVWPGEVLEGERR
ncbi:MAG: NDP-sugar synthase [Acidimicrobiia bacterium]|nr:NDP-sugar synthase [Acidimicrobiia bacterium]